MSVNKVQLANGETIIDISDSTVTPETLAEGVIAHDASGQKITGRMVPGGGASVQADWNQYDETAPDFIKNKPFGETPTVLYEGTDLVPMEDAGVYFAVLPLFDIVDGQAYSVVIDGVEYATKGGRALGAIPFIGNPAYAEVGEDDGSPYICMLDMNSGEGMQFVTFAPFTSIRITTNAVTKIDQKYIPFSAVFLGFGYYKGGTTKYLYDNADNVVTLSELKSWCRLGYSVYVRYGFDVHTPIVARIDSPENYGFLDIIKEDGTRERFYTSEYTPET